MTPIWLGLVLLEMALIVVLRFEEFLGEWLMLAVLLLEGRGRLVTRTVAATMVIIFSSAIYKVLCAVRHFTHANNLVEASLIGFSLLLGMLICGLHYSVARHYMLRILRGALLQELASP